MVFKMTPTSKQSDGLTAEQLAANFLEQRGLVVVAKNYHCRFGEIDLIAKDGETLVFIEVRLRRSEDFGGALASIDSRKQQKLIASAKHYLSRLKATEIPCRFDVLLLNQKESYAIHWLKNAFSE
jgi:putative endonuclease